MGAHCRVDHFEWWIEVMYSLGLILQRLCGFTGIYRAARAPKKKKKKIKAGLFSILPWSSNYPSPYLIIAFWDHVLPREIYRGPSKRSATIIADARKQRSRKTEKQGSREGPKLLSAAWKEHRSPPLPSIWAPGKIATWRNRTLEKKHIEDGKFQTLECSTKRNSSHWNIFWHKSCTHVKVGFIIWMAQDIFGQIVRTRKFFSMVLPFNNIRPAWIGSPCVISCV